MTNGADTPSLSRGSAMSSKQLARTVIDGRGLVLHISGYEGGPLRGYLCGMDDFHIFVITPDGEKHLVHKGSVAVMSLEPEALYSNEPRIEELEKVIAPFRSALQRDHLAPTTSARKERLSA